MYFNIISTVSFVNPEIFARNVFKSSINLSLSSSFNFGTIFINVSGNDKPNTIINYSIYYIILYFYSFHFFYLHN